MQVFMQPLENLKEFEEITQKLPKNKGILQLSGCVETQKADVYKRQSVWRLFSCSYRQCTGFLMELYVKQVKILD